MGVDSDIILSTILRRILGIPDASIFLSMIHKDPQLHFYLIEATGTAVHVCFTMRIFFDMVSKSFYPCQVTCNKQMQHSKVDTRESSYCYCSHPRKAGVGTLRFG